MAFPPVYTFIGLPYAATPSVAAGASFLDTAWPVSALTNGSAKTAWRSANTTGAVLLDLGSAQPCNFFACFGHNFDRTLILSVQMANNPGMSSPVLSRGVGVKQPAFWLDLRTLNGQPTTARYLQFAWVGNSRPATIGELSVGLATGFKGVIDGEPSEQITAPQQRMYLEYGQLVTSSPGVINRTMDLTLSLTAAERTQLAAIEAAVAAANGARVVVVPSTHRNDAWLVEWPAFVEVEHPESDQIVRAPLPLIEEVFGVR